MTQEAKHETQRRIWASLSPSEREVLQKVYERGYSTSKELAEESSMRYRTISSALSTLEKKGLIHTMKNPLNPASYIWMIDLEGRSVDHERVSADILG